MAEKPDTFIREVDEELRREQLKQVWDQYGFFIAGGAVALLAAVWGYTHWQSSRAASAALHGVQFEEAARLARDGKTEDAIKAFTALSKSAAPGYQGLAELRLAALQSKAGKVAEAVAAYDAIARDTSIDLIVRDLAGVKAANLRLPTADLAEMERRLSTLTAEGAPWRSAAKELLGLAFYKAAKFEDARKVFEQLLVDRSAPQGMSERAQLMLAVLTDADAAKAAPVPAEAPKGATPPEKTKDKSPANPPAQKK